MVIVIAKTTDFDYTPYYPDPRIKFIACVDSDFNNTLRLRTSLEGFISEGNKYYSTVKERILTI
jgi:hypothetical protein